MGTSVNMLMASYVDVDDEPEGDEKGEIVMPPPQPVTETKEQRAKRLKLEAQRRRRETIEERAMRLEYQRSYRAKKRAAKN